MIELAIHQNDLVEQYPRLGKCIRKLITLWESIEIVLESTDVEGAATFEDLMATMEDLLLVGSEVVERNTGNREDIRRLFDRLIRLHEVVYCNRWTLQLPD